MVNPIIGAYEPPAPISKDLQPTQAPTDPTSVGTVSRIPQGSNTQDASLSSGKAEEINSKLALSRDVSRINPSQIYNNSLQRGAVVNSTA
jgi:hypothetical protein